MGEEEERAGLGVGIDFEVAAFDEDTGAVGEDAEALVGVGAFGFEEHEAGGGLARLCADEEASAGGQKVTFVVEVLELGDAAAEEKAKRVGAALEEVFGFERAEEFISGV